MRERRASDAPPRVLGWVSRTLATQLLAVTALHTIRPMVSYRALELGAGTAQLGFIAAAYAVLSSLLAVPVGRRVDRFGEPRFLVIGTATIGGVALWLTTVDSLTVLAATQALLGLGQLGVALGAQALLASGGLPEQRDARIGAMTVTVSIAHLVGPALGGWLASGGGSLQLVWLTSAGSALLATVFAVTVLLRPPTVHEAADGGEGPGGAVRGQVAAVARLPGVPYAILASLTALSTVDILTAYLPAFGEANGIPVATVGVLLSVRAGAMIISRAAMLPLLRLLGRRHLLAGTLILPGLALLALPLSTTAAGLGVIMAFAGFGLGLTSPLTLVWLSNQVPVHARGMTLGMRITGNRVGQVALPAMVGALAGVTGLWAVFVAAGLMLTTSAGAVFRAPLED